SKKAVRDNNSGVSPQALITRGGAIFGAVGVLILLVQIFVNSTRYHARLADLYLAQANALRASNGNLAAAELLLKELTPLSVDFGKAPTSIYEKAIEAVRDVAKAGAQSRK
ncbi:MAG: hypothetical protein JKX94_08790, partial [Sneathiella sp.]|nr:hypothetical protein [Sneathiella sp.]